MKAASVSVGGAIGALARWALSAAFPAPPEGFPWAVLAINVSGCALIGVLMVLVTDVYPHRELLRPFLGVGVLGGYTTFSTYVIDVQRLVTERAWITAVCYLVGTLALALAAVAVAMAGTRRAVRKR